MPNRSEGAVDNATRCMIAAHRIDCYPHLRSCQVSQVSVVRCQVSAIKSQDVSGGRVIRGRGKGTQYAEGVESPAMRSLIPDT
jgi:hypothetical protein